MTKWVLDPQLLLEKMEHLKKEYSRQVPGPHSVQFLAARRRYIAEQISLAAQQEVTRTAADGMRLNGAALSGFQTLQDAIAFETVTSDGEITDIPGPGCCKRLLTASDLANTQLLESTTTFSQQLRGYTVLVREQALQEVVAVLHGKRTALTPLQYVFLEELEDDDR